MNRCSAKTEGRRGFAFLAALAMVTVLATLSVAVCWQVRSSLLQSRNLQRIQGARLQAESGLSYMCHLLTRAPVPITIKVQDTMNSLAGYFQDRLAGASALQGQIQYDGTTIQLPPIATSDADQSFSATLWMPDARTLCVGVTGRCGPVTRSHQMDFTLVGGHPIFGFGMSSKGPICLENTVSVRGANDPTEARLLSMSPDQAFRLMDMLTLDGDVYATDPNAQVLINGIGTIAGTPMDDPSVWDHVHIGEGVPNFPEVDTSAFEGFATNIVDADTITSGDKKFTNIRIKAGTNPTFANGAKLDGVVFIEQPNQVTFAEGTTITGVICTDGTSTLSKDNQIKFELNTHSYGVDALPDTAEFHELRQMTGSFILAPDFTVRFENESGVINGMIAAGHVKFENSFHGTLCGGILSYSTVEIMAENMSDFTIDHSKYGGVPSGFNVDKPRLVPDSSTYTEH